jgi:dTDP-D-glucose 4,6-dehydratase
MYEFTKPFVVDSSRMEGQFGLQPTEIDHALERTVRWYQNDFRPH